MAKEKEKNNSVNPRLVMLGLLLAFLAIIDISTLYIWKTYNSPSVSSTFSSAKVMKIIDGQTIVLDDGQYVKLLGIDAPLNGSSLYQEAITALSLMVLNKQIKLEKDSTDMDSSGRMLRYVYVDYNGQQLFVNKELVRQGYALSFFLEPNVKYRTEIEQARQDCLKDKIRLCG